MVNGLDFEEIDQALEDMSNMDGITDAIAKDVAKLDENVVKKTTHKKAKSNEENVVKNTTTKAKPKPSKSSPKPKPATDVKAKKTAPKKSKKDDDKGEIVMVKVKKAPPPEPEEVVFQPNPKTGRFMDIVSPLSDMSIKGMRPSTADKEVADDAILISETSAVVAVEPEPIEDLFEKDEMVADRERIMDAGLDPDALIGDLASQIENVSDEDPDALLDSILEDLDGAIEAGDDAEVETASEMADEIEAVSEIADEVADEVEESLEKLADILDIPDHSDAFLENVEVDKRPLSGEQEVASMVSEKPVVGDDLDVLDKADVKPEKEVVKEAKTPEKLPAEKKVEKPKNKEKIQKTNFKTSGKKSSNVVLYVLLIILFVVLGASLGVLAFFSGLF